VKHRRRRFAAMPLRRIIAPTHELPLLSTTFHGDLIWQVACIAAVGPPFLENTNDGAKSTAGQAA
jgi:hypothetical protein